ncbi:MAG: sigma-70 family RNA polymerase sigma factor [Acidobacteriota bacterium]|nr:sigma-70 family RNA polymerase sigma factor [Acidobacteriota bacterium]
MTSREDANERLLIEAAQNDPRRFSDIYEANFERVYAFIARRVRDRADAEDLTAEVFHQALASLNRFEWRGAPFSAWLYRIASNAIADRWQRAERERGASGSDDPPDSSSANSPEESEKRARLFRLVADLPPDQRCVIEMRFTAGKSIAEIARELGRTDGAVKQLQFRAIRALRAQWDPSKRAKRIRKKSSVKHG